MRILIDGDGCPVVDLTIKISRKFNIEVIIMCDTSHIFNKNGAKTMVFSKGADSVDFALINLLKKDDIVITQDYGLAAMAINKASYVINQNGLIYSNEKIDCFIVGIYLKKLEKVVEELKDLKKEQKKMT